MDEFSSISIFFFSKEKEEEESTPAIEPYAHFPSCCARIDISVSSFWNRASIIMSAILMDLFPDLLDALAAAVAEMQWRAAQDHLAAENYMMSMGPSAYNNPYWTGMQPGLDGFAAPYHGAMPYNPYGFGPLDVPFVPPVLPQDPFGGQGFMLPFGPPMQRYNLCCLLS